MEKLTNEQLDNFSLKNALPMNSLRIMIPYDYFTTLVNMNWDDISFAIRNRYLNVKYAIKYAQDEMEKNPQYSGEVLDLAILDPEEVFYQDIIEHISKVIGSLPLNEDQRTKDKILYVALSWVYKNKERWVDPFWVVAYIYADFDYPESIKDFVYYMPTETSPPLTQREGINQMYKKWNRFMEEKRKEYKI